MRWGMTMKALEVQNLSAGYGKIQVLWDVNLAVEEGQFASIIGANGAGKTTLLRTISGLLPTWSGSARALQKGLTSQSAARIVHFGVGHVPEGRQVFRDMTVAENIESGADYLPAARSQAAKSRRFVLDLFPRLAERSGQLAGTLSGGELQMLAIARALMGRPRVLLVDEPSLGLSPALTKVVFNALKTINSEGTTVILVEQNVKQSLKLADRAFVLENGRIVREGRGAELLQDAGVRASYLAL